MKNGRTYAHMYLGILSACLSVYLRTRARMHCSIARYETTNMYMYRNIRTAVTLEPDNNNDDDNNTEHISNHTSTTTTTTTINSNNDNNNHNTNTYSYKQTNNTKYSNTTTIIISNNNKNCAPQSLRTLKKLLLRLRPVNLLRVFLLRVLQSNFPGDSL